MFSALLLLALRLLISFCNQNVHTEKKQRALRGGKVAIATRLAFDSELK